MARLHLTKATSPALFQACLDMYYDNGAVNRMAPEPREILIAATRAEVIAAERGLQSLSAEERELFATGEDHVAEAIAQRSQELRTASQLLDRVFQRM